jgi:dihydrofolate synthase/folylpolyglutamate synthase
MDRVEIKYQECLNYIYEKLPMFTRVGAVAYKPNLDNIIALCEAIGNPHLQFKSIHIAGTNGKGSCSHMLASALLLNGYKTGLYTSPHVIDFRERIRINGIEIPKENVIDFIDETKQLIENLKPSFFEITVAMAFDYFAKEKVDIVVVEVGLGGLLDSTNIIKPEVSVITNISKDHTNLLGNTIEEIAIQKAGIIKEEVPVVIGETQVETEKIFFSKTILHHSQIFFADKLYAVVHQETIDGKMKLKIMNYTTMSIQDYWLDLLGEYQIKNIKTVLTTLDVLKSLGWKLDNNTVMNALSKTKKTTGLKGRFDLVSEKPKIVFDVSHNEAGISELIKQIEKLNYEKLYIILGFVSDKDVQKVLTMFPKSAYYFFSQAQIPRALPYHELQKIGFENELKGQAIATIVESLQQARDLATDADMILVTGSFFNLEEAYQLI